MRLYFHFLILLVAGFGLLIISCGNKKSRKGYTLDKGKLVEMIIDHQIAKAAVYKYPINLRDSMSGVFHEQIYKIHDIDQYTFERDINKLETEPDYYKEVYDEVHRILKEMRPDSK